MAVGFYYIVELWYACASLAQSKNQISPQSVRDFEGEWDITLLFNTKYMIRKRLKTARAHARFKTLGFLCRVLGGPPGEAGRRGYRSPLRRADRCGVSCRR